MKLRTVIDNMFNRVMRVAFGGSAHARTPSGRRRTAIVVFVAASLALATINARGLPVASAQTGPNPPPNQPERGLVYDGLVPVTDGPCRGLYQVQNTEICTHGPDPAPPGVDISQSVAPIAPTTEPEAPFPTAALCYGDGVSGPRTQVLYARAADRSDRYTTYLASFRQWAADANSIYQASAAETGGYRQIRFVTDASCNLTIPDVTLSVIGDDSFGNTISELQAQGFKRTDRKCIVFVDANVSCGIGGFLADDQPGPANRSNGGPSYGRTDAGCWSGAYAAHEHMHNLGGVQLSAPHSSGGAHCVDEWDLMCYSDSPYSPPMQYLCPDLAHDQRFDCNHDDYYSTNPPAGSYLATHWNTADSQFLVADWRATTSMRTARANHTVTLLSNGQVLVAGGVDSTGTLATAELYDPASGTWRATASMSIARAGHTATLLSNGQVLVVGSDDYAATAELYDPASGTWRATASMRTPRVDHTATLLPNGQVLVAGGVNVFGTQATAELYDPASGTWRATTNIMHAARANHTATLLSNSQVLVAGGGDFRVFPATILARAELYTP